VRKKNWVVFELSALALEIFAVLSSFLGKIIQNQLKTLKTLS
jgi:hypothetical protein